MELRFWMWPKMWRSRIVRCEIYAHPYGLISEAMLPKDTPTELMFEMLEEKARAEGEPMQAYIDSMRRQDNGTS